MATDRPSLLRRILNLRALAARAGTLYEGRIAARAAQKLQKAIKATNWELGLLVNRDRDSVILTDWNEPWHIILLDHLCTTTRTGMRVDLFDIKLNGHRAGVVAREAAVIRCEIEQQVALHRESLRARSVQEQMGWSMPSFMSFGGTGASTAAIGGSYTISMSSRRSLDAICAGETDDVIAIWLTLGMGSLSKRVQDRVQAEAVAAKAEAVQEEVRRASVPREPAAPSRSEPEPARPPPEIGVLPAEPDSREAEARASRERLMTRVSKVGNHVRTLSPMNPELVKEVVEYVPATFWGERFHRFSHEDDAEPLGLLTMQ